MVDGEKALAFSLSIPQRGQLLSLYTGNVRKCRAMSYVFSLLSIGIMIILKEREECHMVEKELKDLISQIQTRGCEEQTTEVKAAHGGCPEKLYDTISAFSNQNSGGKIILRQYDDRRTGYVLCLARLHRTRGGLSAFVSWQENLRAAFADP